MFTIGLEMSKISGGSPQIREKSWIQSWGWFFIFLIGALFVYLHFMNEKSRTFTEMKGRLQALESEKKEALQTQTDLQLQIQSQSDPAWVEMVLKRDLGMVRDGEVKVYFQPEPAALER